MAASLVSCKKENEGASSQVKFQIVSTDTKAAVTTTESINTKGQQFLIDLFNSNTREIINTSTGSPVIGQTVTLSDAVTDNEKNGLEWILPEITYWEGRTMDAWARYPLTLKGGSIGIVQSNSGDKASDYIKNDDGQVVAINADRTSQSFNFLTYYDETANPRMDADKQDDLLFACSKGWTSGNNFGRIKLTFAHALAAVYFKVAAEDGSGLELGENVILNSVSINNVKRAGSCVYNPSLEDAARFAWNTDIDNAEGLLRSKGSYVQTYDKVLGAGGYILDGTVKDATTNEENPANCFFVIPQAMDPDATLTVNWTKNETAREPRTAQIYKDSKGRVVEWKAGYKYLYTIKIKKLGAELEVDLKVLPWDYSETAIDFDETVANSSPLEFFDAITTVSAGSTLVTYDSKPIRGEFMLDKPVGGQWLVSLSNSIDFEIYTLDASGNKVSAQNIANGLIDGEKDIFYIAPKPGIDPSVDHTTKVFATVVRPDGVTISADEQLKTAQYTILVPKKN